MSWYHNFQYTTVAQQKKRTQKKLKQLLALGQKLDPIVATKGRGLLAKSHWGKAWCGHLEQFNDFENRLPRGRSYARNGSILHLAIEASQVNAMVMGSELYELTIDIDPLAPHKWKALKQRCQGKIGSLIALLQGKLSDEIMNPMTDTQDGLFPLPEEIHFNCNCPDYARMCKHVAAVFYGVGLRLDTAPELLFKLRGVDPDELIDTDTSVDSLTRRQPSRRRRTLDSNAIGAVFGIESPSEDPTPPPSKTRKRTAPPKKTVAPKKRVRTTKKATRKKAAVRPFKPTAATVRALRKKNHLSQKAFATQVGVSPATISNWENSKGTLNLKPQLLAKLATIHQQQTSTPR